MRYYLFNTQLGVVKQISPCLFQGNFCENESFCLDCNLNTTTQPIISILRPHAFLRSLPVSGGEIRDVERLARPQSLECTSHSLGPLDTSLSLRCPIPALSNLPPEWSLKEVRCPCWLLCRASRRLRSFSYLCVMQISNIYCRHVSFQTV